MYAWDEDGMRLLYLEMKNIFNIEQNEFTLMRYYKRKYFSKRVMRFCLPPCKMYFRVRAVFEIFGTKVDVETNKALFNRDAWGKAKNILKEILEGHYSDPPKEPMHTHDLDKDHEITRDKYGIALLKCYRDTNALEGEHSHVNNTFGKRKVGWEFGDNLVAERRHRCNVNACKKNRYTIQTLNILTHG